MAVIDIATQKVVGTLDFGHGVRPHCPLFGPDGMLYVTTELDKSITIIDPKTLKIVGRIPTGQPESHMLTLSHDGRRGYTANVGPGTVSVLDIAARKTLKVIPIPAIPRESRFPTTTAGCSPPIRPSRKSRSSIPATDTVAKWIPIERVGMAARPRLTAAGC